MSPVVRSVAAHGQTAEHIVGHPRRLGLDPVAHADVGRIVALQAHRRLFFRHLQMAAEEFVSFFLILADVGAGEECADGAGVGISAPMRVASLGGLGFFRPVTSSPLISGCSVSRSPKCPAVRA